ncbi:unnamed protein product, partial [Amoebophrya sp. A25]|eukprot:GSA25T00002548001.1
MPNMQMHQTAQPGGLGGPTHVAANLAGYNQGRMPMPTTGAAMVQPQGMQNLAAVAGRMPGPNRQVASIMPAQPQAQLHQHFVRTQHQLQQPPAGPHPHPPQYNMIVPQHHGQQMIVPQLPPPAQPQHGQIPQAPPAQQHQTFYPRQEQH